MTESIGVQLDGTKELLERQEKERLTNLGSVMVIDDDKNFATIPGFPYEFEAFGDKVLIAVDVFKSGYECKDCNGTGRIKEDCTCVKRGRPGFKYNAVAESEPAFNIKCPECQGDYESKHKDETCAVCKGNGALIIVPEASKDMCTTGVIVSVGDSLAQYPRLKNGVRVVFGRFSGTGLPTKAVGIMFKFLRVHEILGFIHKGEPLGSFDFVLPEGE